MSNQVRVYHPLFNYPKRIMYNLPKRSNRFIWWHYHTFPFYRTANGSKKI